MNLVCNVRAVMDYLKVSVSLTCFSIIFAELLTNSFVIFQMILLRHFSDVSASVLNASEDTSGSASSRAVKKKSRNTVETGGQTRYSFACISSVLFFLSCILQFSF